MGNTIAIAFKHDKLDAISLFSMLEICVIEDLSQINASRAVTLYYNSVVVAFLKLNSCKTPHNPVCIKPYFHDCRYFCVDIMSA